ncbi:ATP-binding protein [Flavobacterium limnophilum]|uniref:ATP-binding protein n=1 Tax=Flavobacterium limnophilum TaxID=3003262 RepID=UPI00248219C9|nr:AAA family ATPase [Flavobacterium limnophilum]
MKELQEKYIRKIDATPMDFTRSLMETIRWEARLIGIKGARGVGKTTLILQYIKKNIPIDQSSLYVSLDNIWFADNTISSLVDQFVKQGGKFLFLDEVHKYPNWSQELKNIYDDYPELKIVFTASSLLEILNARADLSRRAIVYTMQGLSYREYLNLKLGLQLPVYSLKDILERHTDIGREINSQIRPLQNFSAYLQQGYFPFFQEVPELYFQRVEEIINLILEIELPLLRKVDVAYVSKLKQLLQIISESVPFVPNVTKLSERIGVNRNTFVSYLYFLEEAHITRNLYKDAKGITQLQKPNKIFLENTNLQYALSPNHANIGNVRETFFLNQLSVKHILEYIDGTDFLVDHLYQFEVGGKSKSKRQIRNQDNSYLVVDDVEYGMGNTIPLWLFGFLY